ncbi:GNAT family N-acetyltransferase [Planococcus shixiaomingii]|uniref:GNAT family N-acetyltransferase n=1 Tax=Planococcus shixiaomingii TaxID=3058393 RepID=UPI0026247523|nr:GNAT family N-acetyltransferase [Planococcus sp. N022]WKA55697.1 GNAT family N-acetyltransferase [Planococcus sp. N022]
MNDIYFEEDYGRLYEKVENGKCEIFEFSHPYGNIKHLFIKREIPMQMLGETYYDLVTPYGYGGPVITSCHEGRKKELVEAFYTAFAKHCTHNNVISEFIRFHPLANNAEDFSSCYEVEHIRNTVGTNLKDFEDPIKSEFSKSKQKSIQKALAAGVEFRVTPAPEDLTKFKEIYYGTMERKNADDYYYFDEEYFVGLLKYFRKNLLLVEVVHEGKTIGMGLNFVYGSTIHIHLSGTRAEFHRLSPAFMLRYALVTWGKENGIELIHEGGGKTNSLDDPLYLFKKQFGKNTSFNFLIARKVWNEEIYRRMCKAAHVDQETEFFPAYRAKAEEQMKIAGRAD